MKSKKKIYYSKIKSIIASCTTEYHIDKVEYNVLEKEINELFRLINEYDNLDLKSFLFKSHIKEKNTLLKIKN